MLGIARGQVRWNPKTIFQVIGLVPGWFGVPECGRIHMEVKEQFLEDEIGAITKDEVFNIRRMISQDTWIHWRMIWDSGGAWTMYSGIWTCLDS